MWNDLLRFLGIRKKPEFSKWRLVPDKDGTYYLEKWHPDVQMYLTAAVRVTPEKADAIIARLEGKILYYRT